MGAHRVSHGNMKWSSSERLPHSGVKHCNLAVGVLTLDLAGNVQNPQKSDLMR